MLAVDASFIPKSAKQTPELAKYWDAKQAKANKGLELSCCAAFDPDFSYAVALQSLQTPSDLAENESRVDHYAKQVKDVLAKLTPLVKAQIAYVVGESYYSKERFVSSVVSMGENFVGKLRHDANLRYLYQGERTGKAGRPRQYEGKVDFKDFSKWQCLKETDAQRIYSQILQHASLKRQIRVVCVISPYKTASAKSKEKPELFFSTDAQQDAKEIMKIYKCRFHIEFCFRDAKQFSGLVDCQSRQKSAIDFHWNMAFLALNLTKAKQLLAHVGKTETFVFSMEDAKRRAYNELLAQRIFRFLPFGQTFINSQTDLDSLLNLGVKAA